jgi:flagellar biosynthetic protein FliP
MTTTTTHEAHVATPTSAGVSWRGLSVHYVEMILAMVAGMVVLGTLRDLVGLSPAFDTQPVAWYLLMATDMSIGMAAWMRFRRHGWPGILEMCAAMYVPGVLLPLVLGGVLDMMTFMVVAHVAMPVLMLAVLLRRRAEFGGQHH